MGHKKQPMNTLINTHEVHNVKTFFTAHTIRKSVVSIAALALISLPLISSAAPSSGQEPSRSLLNSEWQPVSDNSADALYGKMKSKTRSVCGSSDRRIAGGVQRSREVEQCYDETLTAAVQRLDNPDVNSIHYQ